MFFNKSAKKDKTTRRTSTNNADLKELRVKARRRLIGALALVLAAFIVVPLLFDDPSPDQNNAPLVVPAAPDSLSSSVADESFNQNFSSLDSDPIIENGPSGQISDSLASDLGLDEVIGEHTDLSDDRPVESKPESADSNTVEKVKPVAESTKKEPQKPVDKPSETKQPAQVKDDRTDDGSVALALLEGKTPADTAKVEPKASGSYYLQIAAYTTEQDANTRRDSLINSGVSNAYVESGQSNGQTVYRLRVGPFSSQQAAQAAQTRLRALGYPNGLISAK